MSAKHEQETTITISRTDPVVRVWTNDTRYLSFLRNAQKGGKFATELSGDEGMGTFEIPIENFLWTKAIYAKRVMSDEKRAELAARLKSGREHG